MNMLQNDPSYIVIAENLQKKFNDVVAIHHLDMKIQAGTLTALVGPDGAGKTTFLRMIAGLYLPTEGSLDVLGIDVIKNPQAVQNRISYMPQRFGLYEDLSIQENLNLYADLHGVPKEERKQRFAKLLQITDLTRFTERPAGKLSGGMKQKLGLACTLVRSPELLLLDEPSVGVDPLSRRDLWEIIEKLVQDENLSVIISTSYMDEAERCKDIYIMYDGNILKEGSPLELKEKVRNLTWQVSPPSNMKVRTLQAYLLEQNQYICDAVPKGNNVRFITKETSGLPQELLPQGSVIKPREPELEDAFMFFLHQAQNRENIGDYENLDSKSDSLETKDHSKNSDSIIVVKDLVRTFGDFTAVASTSFDVHKGEIFGLLGPNGAGKTTTFRMLCGLLPATSGFLSVANMNLRTASAQARAKIGYVSQKFALYGNLSVLDNLRFFGGAYGLSGKNLTKKIEKMLNQFDLHTNDKSGDLPNGFKQRLSMAAALLHQPEILFLDEPTSGIDPLARRMFWYTIGKLANQGITIIVTTHFMEEAEYCDRICIQDAGKMLAIGSPEEIRKKAGDHGVNDMNSAFIAIVEQFRAHDRSL